ncbi:hypothetical protein C0J52_21504 [Blattella germanica]|nr:hypothetical protein C0J52_21504 [Blattella germanica]
MDTGLKRCGMEQNAHLTKEVEQATLSSFQTVNNDENSSWELHCPTCSCDHQGLQSAALSWMK